MAGFAELRKSLAALLIVGNGVACVAFSTSPNDASPEDDAGPRVSEAGDVGDAAREVRVGAPAVVAQGIAASHIACDEEAAYVIAGTKVLRIAPTGSPVTLATTELLPRFVAVDGTRVYWLAGGGGGWTYVRATEKLGADGGGRIDSYYGDGSGTDIYSFLSVKAGVIAMHGRTSATEARVFRGATDGSGGVNVATGQDAVIGVATDGPFVYWLSPKQGAVLRSEQLEDGGGAQTFATGSVSPASIAAASGGEVFWASDDGSLRALRTDEPGGQPRVVSSGLDNPRQLALDATHAFWVNFGTGTIATVSRSGGTPAVLATEAPGANLAVCSNAIWFTRVTGAIVRMPRL